MWQKPVIPLQWLEWHTTSMVLAWHHQISTAFYHGSMIISVNDNHNKKPSSCLFTKHNHSLTNLVAELQILMYFFSCQAFNHDSSTLLQMAIWSSIYAVDSTEDSRRARSLSHSSPSSDSLPQCAAFEDAHLANDTLTSVKSAAPRTKMPLVLFGFALFPPATDIGLTLGMEQPIERLGK